MRVAIIIATLASFAAAQDLSRPDPVGTPTKVTAGIYLIDLSKINGADQAMVVDFAVRLTWKDPRLTGPKVVSLDKIWAPRVQLLTERRLFRKLEEIVTIDKDGTAVYRQRFYGHLTAPVHLRDFPLDSHTLEMPVIIVQRPDEVQVVLDSTVTGQRPRMSIPDWEIGEGSARLTSYDFAPGVPRFPGLSYDIPARRYFTFFVWKVLLPLLLIVSMSWTVFWMDPVKHGPQIGVTITSMLTLMAYRVVTAQFLPNLPYLTRLDMFITGSTVLVFLALVQEVATTRMVRKKHPNLARRVDRICRKAFPAAFAVMAFATFAL